MLPSDQLDHLAAQLITVPGIRAVVLGGSRARGTHRPDSDVDLGLYYEGELDLGALTDLARSIPGNERVEIAGPGGWGPWVNGGAWLHVDGVAVDWILRDVRRVREQCERARNGSFAFHAHAGHPLGFLDVSYAGEIATCRILEDPDGLVAEAKAQLDPYPPALTTAMIENLWQARFLVDSARKGAAGGDAAYVQLCCSTALMLCAHAWHAAAGVWVTNEKGLVPGVDRLPLETGGFSAAAHQALTWGAGSGPEEWTSGATTHVQAVDELVSGTIAALAGRS